MAPPSSTTVHGEIQENKESTASSSNTEGETSKSQNNNAEINTKRGPVEEESKKEKEIRAAIMVIATLAATVTYQAILNPPGGFWQDDLQSLNSTGQNHTAGNPVMATKHPLLYGIFVAINTAAFVTSFFVINFLFLPSLRDIFQSVLQLMSILSRPTRKNEQQNFSKERNISSNSIAVVLEFYHLLRYVSFVLLCLLLASALWVFQHLRGPGLVAFLIAFPSICCLSTLSIVNPRIDQRLKKEKEKEKEKEKDSTNIEESTNIEDVF